MLCNLQAAAKHYEGVKIIYVMRIFILIFCRLFYMFIPIVMSPIVDTPCLHEFDHQWDVQL